MEETGPLSRQSEGPRWLFRGMDLFLEDSLCDVDLSAWQEVVSCSVWRGEVVVGTGSLGWDRRRRCVRLTPYLCRL